MINFLVGGEPLVKIRLALGVRPEQVPIVPLRANQPVQLANEPDQLTLALEQLVEDLIVFFLASHCTL